MIVSVTVTASDISENIAFFPGFCLNLGNKNFRIISLFENFEKTVIIVMSYNISTRI